MHWERIQQWRRGKDLGKLEKRSKREWSELYGRQERQREQLAKDCRWGVGALRAMAGAGRRSARDRWDDPGTHGSIGALSGGAGGPATLGADLAWGKRIRKRCVRIESKAGEVYRGGMEGAEGRAREGDEEGRAPTAVYDRRRGGDSTGLKYSASEERMEQVREFDGEQAYEKMMQTMEEARQEKASQEQGKAREGQGKWRGQGWSGLDKRRPGKAGSAVGRNAADRSGTLVPAAKQGSIREAMPGGLLFMG